MKTKVVIIDDHHLFNDGLSLILKERPLEYEVVAQVYDSKNAISVCSSLVPDLVLIDYNMPVMNGLDVLKGLQETAVAKQMKFVIISMFADYRETDMFKTAGAHGYIMKTTPAQELFEKLKLILSGEQYFNEIKKKEKLGLEADFGRKFKLTRREVEIIRHLKNGETTDKIADLLSLSPYTVSTHRRNVHQKLGFSTNAEFLKFIHSQEF